MFTIGNTYFIIVLLVFTLINQGFIGSEETAMACDSTYRRQIKNAGQFDYRPFVPVFKSAACQRTTRIADKKSKQRNPACRCCNIYLIS